VPDALEAYAAVVCLPRGHRHDARGLLACLAHSLAIIEAASSEERAQLLETLGTSFSPSEQRWSRTAKPPTIARSAIEHA
jgi:hypothetical protein